MAAFLVAFPSFRPDDYWKLTGREYTALATARTRTTTT